MPCEWKPSCTSTSVGHLWPSSEGKEDGHLVLKPQTAWQMSACLQQFGWECLVHPPYSLDYAPSDLPGPLKKHLGCHRFHCESARTWLSVVLFTKPRILCARSRVHRNVIIRKCFGSAQIHRDTMYNTNCLRIYWWNIWKYCWCKVTLASNCRYTSQIENMNYNYKTRFNILMYYIVYINIYILCNFHVGLFTNFKTMFMKLWVFFALK